MPILAVHGAEHPDPQKRHTVEHRCVRCGHERHLRIDPTAGHLMVDTERRGIATSPCPSCAEEVDDNGNPLVHTESFRTDIAPWEAQEPLPDGHPMYERWGGVWQHPGSLKGVTFDNTRRDVHGRPLGPILSAVVEEHLTGYHPTPETVEQCRHIRALMAHPHMAKHVPLDDSAHHKRHAAAEKRRDRSEAELLALVYPRGIPHTMRREPQLPS